MKDNGLLHVFVDKIPYGYGYKISRSLSRDHFGSLNEMIQDLYVVWNRDRVKARNISAVMANESGSVLKTTMQEAMEKFWFQLHAVLEKGAVSATSPSATRMENSSVDTSDVTSDQSVAVSNLQLVELLTVSIAERVTLQDLSAVSSFDSSVSTIAEHMTDVVYQGTGVQCSVLEELSHDGEEIEVAIYSASVSDECGVCSVATQGEAVSMPTVM
jgi:hypothetical protein